MKYYIHTDLEGISGFVDLDEIDIKQSRGIQYTKEILTEEVNSAIRGIRKADSSAEFLVQDGHGGGWWGPNIIFEKLDPAASLIQGKRGSEIVGLDASFDLLLHIGAHSMAGTHHGLMSHTISMDAIHNVWINGRKMGEIGLVATYAGYFGVPVGLVSGDYWAVLEAQELLGKIEGVAVKKGLNQNTAVCLAYEVTIKMIEEQAEIAAKRAKSFTPLNIEGGLELKIEYVKTTLADKAEIRGAKRIDGRTVSFFGENITEVIDLI